MLSGASQRWLRSCSIETVDLLTSRFLIVDSSVIESIYLEPHLVSRYAYWYKEASLNSRVIMSKKHQSAVPAIQKRRRGSGQATLGDVAQLAGVAPITVSRFVRDPLQVSDELRRKIEAAIAALDYVPNRVAQGLAGAQSSSVVAIMPSLSHSVFSQMLQVLTQHLQAAGYQLLLGNSAYSLVQEEHLLRTFLDWRPAAVVLAGHTHTEGTHELLGKLQIPVIETWDLSPDSSHYQVGFSHVSAGAAMTQHLVEKGYQRIAYVHNCLVEDLRSGERGEGYLKVMRTCGLVPRIFDAHGNSPFDAGHDALLALMNEASQPDAIFFANDNLAAGALLEAQRRGWKIPRKVAIAGFGAFPVARHLVPSLTTLQPDHERIAQIVAEIVRAHYGRNRSNQSGRQIDVGFTIAQGESA